MGEPFRTLGIKKPFDVIWAWLRFLYILFDRKFKGFNKTYSIQIFLFFICVVGDHLLVKTFPLLDAKYCLATEELGKEINSYTELPWWKQQTNLMVNFTQTGSTFSRIFVFVYNCNEYRRFRRVFVCEIENEAYDGKQTVLRCGKADVIHNLVKVPSFPGSLDQQVCYVTTVSKSTLLSKRHGERESKAKQMWVYMWHFVFSKYLRKTLFKWVASCWKIEETSGDWRHS